MQNTDRILKGFVVTIVIYSLAAIYTRADQEPVPEDNTPSFETHLSGTTNDEPHGFFNEPINGDDITSPETDVLRNTSSESAPATVGPLDDPLENYHGDMELGETSGELSSPPAEEKPDTGPATQSEVRPYDDMGYRVVEGPNGPELDYNPHYDERLAGEHKPNPLLSDHRDFERQNMHEALHRFLNHDLNPLQRELLQEFLLEQISGPPKSTAEMMAEEMRGKDISPESFAQLTHIAISLYYYRNYIYQALVQHASKETPVNESGLIMPHVVAMSEQLISQLPHAKPFINIALVVPIAARLFYDNLQIARQVEGQLQADGSRRDGSDFRTRAYAASSYAVMLGLFAQASAGFLSKFTTFQSYPAGMLASAYRNWKTGDFWQVAIDGFMTLQNLKHRRGLISAAIAATVLNYHNIPNENESLREWYERPLDANYMIPTLLSVCMTHDWGSSLVTGSILAINQLLFMGRDKFLEPGHLYQESQPYIMGFTGSAIALAATLAVYWKNIPGLEKTREGLNYILTEASDWITYLLLMKGVTRPDWERSGLLDWVTRHYAWMTMNRYQGEHHIVTEDTWNSDTARIQGNEPSLSQKMSSWFSYLMGYDRTDLVEKNRNELDNNSNPEIPQALDDYEEMSAWDEFNTPPKTE